MSRPKEVFLVSASEAGHRASYLALFSALFPSRRAKGIGEVLLAPNPALFLMIEESFGAYVTTALVRAMLGRRTTGLLFRPGPALTPTNLRLRLKTLALCFLKRLPQVTTLTILPFSLDPRMASIADGWIHDPQMWDLTPADREAIQAGRQIEAGLTTAIREKAGSRAVVSAIGRQDHDKGFDVFTGLYADNASLRESFLFAYGGKVVPELAADVASLADAGGFAAERFISDAEVLELYAASDLIWCTYSRGYDQASGIFGRAVQLGMTAVVREGSLIHRQCLEDSLLHIAITEETAATRLLAYEPGPIRSTREQSVQWRQLAIATLHDALGLNT